jgi:hypothetical protein
VLVGPREAIGGDVQDLDVRARIAAPHDAGPHAVVLDRGPAGARRQESGEVEGAVAGAPLEGALRPERADELAEQVDLAVLHPRPARRPPDDFAQELVARIAPHLAGDRDAEPDAARRRRDGFRGASRSWRGPEVGDQGDGGLGRGQRVAAKRGREAERA